MDSSGLSIGMISRCPEGSSFHSPSTKLWGTLWWIIPMFRGHGGQGRAEAHRGRPAGDVEDHVLGSVSQALQLGEEVLEALEGVRYLHRGVDDPVQERRAGFQLRALRDDGTEYVLGEDHTYHLGFELLHRALDGVGPGDDHDQGSRPNVAHASGTSDGHPSMTTPITGQ